MQVVFIVPFLYVFIFNKSEITKRAMYLVQQHHGYFPFRLCSCPFLFLDP